MSTGTLQNFIGGSFTGSADPATREHVNPSNVEEVVSVLPRGTARDVADAVTAASRALPEWRALAAPARSEFLYKWGAAIAGRADELAKALVREVGKPIAEARGEVARCSVILRYFAGEAVRPVGSVIPAQTAGSLQYSVQEPLGIVALITPWNFPLAIPMWKTAPALALGNVVVLKPSEFSSGAANLLAQTAREAGLPAGVFNVVMGEGLTVGQPLLEHEQVRAVSFTGSRVTGAAVAAIASRRNIRYQTEMGGKNIAIVLRDADLERAATLTASGAFRYAGQKCTATSRVVVDASIEDRFLELLREKTRALALGPAGSDACAIGPLINSAARERVASFLSRGNGAVIEGGEGIGDPDLARGNYMAPAIVRNPSHDSELAQEEIFGPVVASFVARDVDEAIALANSTRYGLSASLFTTNIRDALRYVSGIEVGMVRVNADTTGVDPHAPFGGMKSSSSGMREQGPAAREFYSVTKTVQINP